MIFPGKGNQSRGQEDLEVFLSCVAKKRSIGGDGAWGRRREGESSLAVVGFFMVRCAGGGLDRLLDWVGWYGEVCLFVLFVCDIEVDELFLQYGVHLTFL